MLVIELPPNWQGPQVGSIADPDAIVRAGERDPREALHLLATTAIERSNDPQDWTNALSQALRVDSSLSLELWADATGLHPGSLSRGFTRVFGTTPAAYRSTQRTQKAIDALIRTDAPLSRIAAECGFADQAHMSRAIANMAGATPAMLRRQHRS